MMTSFPLVCDAKSGAFMVSVVLRVVFTGNPKIDHIGVSVLLMNLVRPPRTMSHKLRVNGMTPAYEPFRNWFTVTDNRYLGCHELTQYQLISYETIVFFHEHVLCYKAFIMLWKLKPYWLWSAINHSVVAAA